jgi:hypothetical protein
MNYQKINLFLIFLIVFMFFIILYSKLDKNLPILKIIELKSEPQIENDINKLIFGSSDEQKLIDRNVLLKTIQFMIDDREEHDQTLVDFVSSLINRPSMNKKLNLKNKDRTDFSQIGQSKYIDGLLMGMRNGFFIGDLKFFTRLINIIRVKKKQS